MTMLYIVNEVKYNKPDGMMFPYTHYPKEKSVAFNGHRSINLDIQVPACLVLRGLVAR